MSGSVYYHQGCPVCGRMLRIGVRLLGQRVFCQHCGGGFRASDADLQHDHGDRTEGEPSPIDRIEVLLQQAAATLERTSMCSAPTREPAAGIAGD
jgi:hypothetical protein